MSSNSPESDSFCPYLAVGGTYPPPRPSSRARCHAGVTARVVPTHRQTALCLGSEYARCPEYLRHSPLEEPEQQGWAFSLRTVDTGFAGRALISLMVGIIVLAFFAMAPRPLPMPLSDAAQLAVTETPVPNGAGGGGDPSPTEAAPPGAQSPVPSPTPVPPTATPARASILKPTAGPVRTYVVQPRDTLYSIARAHGVTVEALSKANSVSDPRRLRAGQILRIP